MKVQNHLPSSHRPVQARVLANLRSNNNSAYIITACLLAVLTVPVALGWWQKPEPTSTRNVSSSVVESTVKQQPPEQLPQPTQPSEGANTQVEASTVITDNQPSTHLSINGQNITVPQNGTVTKVVPSPAGGATNVSVSTSSGSSGSSSTQSFTSIQTNSTSQSSTIANSSP